jgi:ferredoxin
MSRKDGKSVLLKSVEKKGVWTLPVDEEELAANEVVAKMCPSRIIQLRS